MYLFPTVFCQGYASERQYNILRRSSISTTRALTRARTHTPAHTNRTTHICTLTVQTHVRKQKCDTPIDPRVVVSNVFVVPFSVAPSEVHEKVRVGKIEDVEPANIASTISASEGHGRKRTGMRRVPLACERRVPVVYNFDRCDPCSFHWSLRPLRLAKQCPLQRATPSMPPTRQRTLSIAARGACSCCRRIMACPIQM